MADYYQVKNQNIFNPPANTYLGNATNQYNSVYVQNDLVLGNVTVTGATIIAPRITTITYPGDDTAADTAGGQTITLTGTGFVAGANVLINGSAVGVVSVVSSTTITFTSPANATGSYVIYVVNPDGSTAIAIPGIQYSGTPTWTTAAGSLGNVYETASFNQTVTATGDAPITYSVFSGSLPPGSTFNANGTITGTSQLLSSPTTYSFTVRATDAQLQDTNRAFSISVIPDVVTWSSPTNNATYSPAANVAMANITLSATSAVGSGITYSANTLPTGLSLTGSNISGTPTVVANTSSLLTATANTTSESSSITINWVVSVASDPYFMYNSLLLPGNGTNGAQNNTFLDGSTNNFTITRNGNTTQGTFSPYGPNWSSYFNGASYLSVADNAALEPSNSSFSAELFVNFASVASDAQVFSKRANTTSYPPFQIILIGGVLQLYMSSTGSSFDVVSAANIVTPTAGVWYHVVVARSGTTISYYVNGTRSGTLTSSATLFNNTGPMVIGGDTNGAYSTSYISNVRYLVGTSAYDATQSTYTVPTSPLTAITNTQLLTCQSNRFIDNSTNAFALTVNGAPTVQRFSPFSPGATYSAGTIGGSGYFDGTGDYLLVPTATPLVLSGGVWTIECWCYLTSSSFSTYRVLINKRSGSSAASYDLYFNITNGYLAFYNGTGYTSTVVPIINAWNHIAAVYDGTNINLYMNGVRVLQTATTNPDNGGNLYIGADENGTSNFFIGYVSDVRILKGTTLYSGTTYTIPTAPLTAIANTSLLLNYTNAGIIDNTMINNLETVGNAQISTAQNKFGSGSMYFDGTGDYLLPQAGPQYAFGTGNFTVECWIYATNPNVSPIYEGRNSGASGAAGFTLTAFSSSSITIFAGGYLIQSTGTTYVNIWTHVAVVKSGATTTLYINGISAGTTTGITNITDQSVIIGGGRYASDSTITASFTGYIDDFRITKGYARYTTTFTPPTSAFPTY